MPPILFEKRPDGVALITFNRPDRLNAFWGDMSEQFRAMLEECGQDPAVRCVALTGAGRAFCVGADLKAMQEHHAGAAARRGVTERLVEGDAREWAHVLERGPQRVLWGLPIPTVALINGVAAGNGLGHALHCDIRLASERARIITGFRNVGLSGDGGVSFFFTRLMGPARALEYLYTGAEIDAARALELGLVNRVYPHDALLEEGLAFCAELASGPPQALVRMKANVQAALTGSYHDAVRLEAMHQAMSHQTEDHRRAVEAFRDKRPPTFEGR